MKFEDALKKIDGAESVGGQLIVNRGGRNVLVGKSVQGTLIVEDTDEAKSIVFEVDKKAYADGREVSEFEDDQSILSTHPVEAALHPTEPHPNLDPEDNPRQAAGTTEESRRQERKDAKEARATTHDLKVDDKVEPKDNVNPKK